MVRLGDLHPQVSHLLLVTVRADDGQALVQDRHHGHQLGPHLNQATNEILSQLKQASIDYHLLTGHALDRWSLGQLRPLSLAEVSSEVDGPSPVVDTDLNINIIYYCPSIILYALSSIKGSIYIKLLRRLNLSNIIF